MPSTPHRTPVDELPETERQSRSGSAVNRLGHWLLSSTTTEPGWDQLIGDFKPAPQQPGAYLARITEIRGERELTGATGVVSQESSVVPVLEELRRSTYTRDSGAWLSASLIIQAEGWPEPAYQVGSDLNFDEEPELWAQEAPLTGEDLVADWEVFPRQRFTMPSWMRERTEGIRGALKARSETQGQTEPTAATSSMAAVSAADAGADAARSAPETSFGTAEVDNDIVNPEVYRALSHFGRKPTEQTIANVVRTLMGGEVLLDISGSTFVPGPNGEQAGPESQIRVQAVLNKDGQRSLAVYLSEETARQVIANSGRNPDELVLSREPAVAVLQNFVNDDSLTDIIVEPNAGLSCRIEGPQAAWAIQTPRNDAAKNALLNGSMQQLVGSFMGPAAVLLLGMRHGDQDMRPVYAQPEDGRDPDTFLLFTSAPEVAALDPRLEVRSVKAVDALRFAVDAGAAYVMINALGPSARLPIAQVEELLQIVEAQEKLSRE
ncbi:SseB family protein [uncultured Kocuria sp.]|uniref:SseB family protein n=1 Tax=uncultured Kocuria sp. TaxID=259305 RepID=UPI00259A4078|nr:SseB family protein [uncultured Kocuria sp.]MCT1368359.1 SseB family protein [Rothia sp. p3-SID1597]